VSAAGDAMLARLHDHTIRIRRAVKTSSGIGMEVRTFEVVATGVECILNRNVAPVGEVGPGMAPIGRRRLYVPVATDVQPRDVIELLTGPDAPQTLEVDEPPTRPRDHHCQLDCILWHGVLPEVVES
jgi:hypothetical protein